MKSQKHLKGTVARINDTAPRETRKAATSEQSLLGLEMDYRLELVGADQVVP